MPSVFAVLRLMKSSNLVGCSTGKSAGFAPLSILCNAAPVEVDNVRSIGHEPTELYELFAHSHYRQPMLCREVDNAFSLIEKHWARKYEKGIHTFFSNRGKCAIQIVGDVHSNKSKVHSQG